MFELLLTFFVIYILILIFTKIIFAKNQYSNKDEQRTEIEKLPVNEAVQQKVKVEPDTNIVNHKDKRPNTVKNEYSNKDEKRTKVDELPGKGVVQQKVKVESDANIFGQKDKRPNTVKNESSNKYEQSTEVEELPEKEVVQQKGNLASNANIIGQKDKKPNTVVKDSRSTNESLEKINSTLDVMNYRNDDHKYGLVVYDRDLQPDGEWCWLYYVYGQKLVCSSFITKSKLYSVSNSEYLYFAKKQYLAWIDINEKQILGKIGHKTSEESRPTPKCKCTVCKGDPIANWSTGSTAAWQGASDRENFRDMCKVCSGSGFVENIL